MEEKLLKKAKSIVKDIIFDLEDRSGIGDAWDGIDDDIKAEIRESWETIICEEMSA
jgi:hypothetical protein